MTRGAAVLAVGGALAATLLLWAGFAEHGSGGYTVRAIFDSASGLRTGMDVRVSGVKVGAVRGVSLDQHNPALPHAVAVMDITVPRMQDFRADAKCTIRAASLLGDRVVDCSPRAPNTGGREAPPLATVTVDGEKQHLLPVTRTSSPVDPDLVLDIFRLPVRQRLSIIIDELGAGLAGNGAALRDAVKRADPALLQLDRVLDVVSDQRRALASLADSGDRVLRPLARERAHVMGAVGHGAELNEAVARRSAALRETFSRLPAFLTELRATLHDVDGLSATAGPALADLDASGRQLSTAAKALAPTARKGTPALHALGNSAEAQRAGLVASQPVLSQLERLTPASKAVFSDLSALLSSLDKQRGIQNLADTPRALSLIANGFDKDGYFARADAIISTCASYVVVNTSACSGVFEKQASSTSASAASAKAPSAGASKGALLDYLLGGER
ncbi:MAG TPA: MlaD family protein [Solirubrobacteraceae bacterium]|nr:MlaD family protein [Solirubrobacteraceae bacterium]